MHECVCARACMRVCVRGCVRGCVLACVCGTELVLNVAEEQLNSISRAISAKIVSLTAETKTYSFLLRLDIHLIRTQQMN